MGIVKANSCIVVAGNLLGGCLGNRRFRRVSGLRIVPGVFSVSKKKMKGALFRDVVLGGFGTVIDSGGLGLKMAYPRL